MALPKERAAAIATQNKLDKASLASFEKQVATSLGLSGSNKPGHEAYKTLGYQVGKRLK